MLLPNDTFSEPASGSERRMVSSEASGAKEEFKTNGVQSYGWRAEMFYAYILQSIKYPDQLYRGHTADLRQRLVEHNAGHSLHTSKFAPWKIKFYAAFETVEQAQKFEAYLKSGSGHAFAKRHLL